jgi:pyrroloquinoline quinone biosynthesis protein B
MPRFSEFLRTQGPWSQLVQLQNIELHRLAVDVPVRLNDRLVITPLTVPHRDEFSETVAFRIEGPRKKVLFLPDIDKWERWERAIEQELATVDVAYLDATFFDGAELPGRDMREIPHPFVVESLQRFSQLNPRERAKIRLIHLNHTNPLLDPESEAIRQTQAAGLGVAEQGERIEL